MEQRSPSIVSFQQKFASLSRFFASIKGNIDKTCPTTITRQKWRQLVALYFCCWPILYIGEEQIYRWRFVRHCIAEFGGNIVSFTLPKRCAFSGWAAATQWPSSLLPPMNRIQPPTHHHRPRTLPSMLVRHCAPKFVQSEGFERWG